MGIEQYLLAAISAETGAIIALFVWFRDAFKKCEARELACTLKYEDLLQRLARIETNAYQRRRAR